MSSDPPDAARPNSFWGPVAFLAGLFLFNFLGRVILGPLLPTIERDLGLSHAQAGSIFFFLSIGYFAGLLGSPLVSARLTHRQTIILSALGVGLALVGMSLVQGLGGLRISALAVGLSAGLYLPSAIPAITGLAQPGTWGRALGIHEIAPNLALLLAPLMAEALLLVGPWPGVTAVLGGGALTLGLAFARFGRGGSFVGQAPRWATLVRVCRRALLWRLAGLSVLGVAGGVGVYAMLPLYLVHAAGYHQSTANLLVAGSRSSGLVMALVMGWLTDRLGTRTTLALVLISNGLLIGLLGLCQGGLLLAAVLLQPALAGSAFVPLFAAVTAGHEPEERGLAVSLVSAVGFIVGGGGAPPLLGLAADLGHFRLGFVVLGLLLLGGLTLVGRKKAA